MFDLLREIAQSLSNNKLRTALTGFAVAWGIFMLIILLGMSHGVLNSFMGNVSAATSSNLNIWPGMTTKAYRGLKDGRRIKFKEGDPREITKENPSNVSDTYATKVLDSAKISTNLDYISESVYGHVPEELKRGELKMVAGRFLQQPDLDDKRKVIVLNNKSAVTLFGSIDKAIGGHVKMLGLSWQVIGVYSHDWEQGSYIPFTTAMAFQGQDVTVSELKVELKNVETMDDAEKVEADVRESLSHIHQFDPADRGAVHIWNEFEGYLRGLQGMTILNIAVWIIGLFTMLTGIVGVSNIMFVSVRERTHEIGVRRAIGAKPRSILLQIVLESVVITTVFGYIGILLGTMVTSLIGKFTEGMDFVDNPTVNLSTAFEVMAVLIVAGALAGLFPAIKATKVKPVEALRDE